MKRNEFRIKEYRGKFYIERKYVVASLKRKTNLLIWKFIPQFEVQNTTTWERVDDYGNCVMSPRTIAEARRFLARRLPYFKTLHKAKAKIEEFFVEPKYHYLK